ncbi:hypothetical protein [Streptomyces decoyicus]|uniref:hypothetical protein n=1 Tax=Streptomyces decoyicus TaxID=249567 RepID=UPI0033B06571
MSRRSSEPVSELLRSVIDEARHTADPVHLVRVFGVSISTAMKYLHTAHLTSQASSLGKRPSEKI